MIFDRSITLPVLGGRFVAWPVYTRVDTPMVQYRSRARGEPCSAVRTLDTLLGHAMIMNYAGIF